MSRFAEHKAKARQVIHDHLAVAAIYRENNAADPVNLTVRWHNKIALSGDLDNGGYTEMIEGVNRVVFNIPELLAAGVKIRQGARLTMVDTSEVLIVGVQEKTHGPIEEIWQVGPV